MFGEDTQNYKLNRFLQFQESNCPNFELNNIEANSLYKSVDCSIC